MRFLARLLVGLCLMAFAAGQELRHEQHAASVPVSCVDPSVCMANGPVVSVTEDPAASGVYTATCASGIVLPATAR